MFSGSLDIFWVGRIVLERMLDPSPQISEPNSEPFGVFEIDLSSLYCNENIFSLGRKIVVSIVLASAKFTLRSVDAY